MLNIYWVKTHFEDDFAFSYIYLYFIKRLWTSKWTLNIKSKTFIETLDIKSFLHKVLAHFVKLYIIIVIPRFRLYTWLWYADVPTNRLGTFMCRNGGQCMHWYAHGVWCNLCTFPAHDELRVDIFQCDN